ncbi:MAG: putative adhesin [Pseudomonadota bacterium]
MPYVEKIRGPLKFNIKEGDDTNNEILLCAHGGYTPKRVWLKMKNMKVETQGSGPCAIPKYIKKAYFYCDDDFYSTGTFIGMAYDHAAAHANRLNIPLTDEVRQKLTFKRDPVKEEMVSFDVTKNYRLTYNDANKTFYPDYGTMDVVRILPGKVAHLQDVFMWIHKLGKSYDIFHYGACRENRKTETKIG